jgi:hypothetical protein
VDALFWNNSPHTALRLVHISLVARDQMDVNVHDGLASRLANVHTNVEASRLQLRVEPCLGSVHQLECRIEFLLGESEEIRNMAEWNDQQMTFADGVAVIASEAELVLENNISCGTTTEGTFLFHKANPSFNG